MKQLFTFILTIALFTSCANFQQVQLSQTDPVNQNLVIGKIPPANILLLNNNGVIDDFNNGEIRWETEFPNIYLESFNGILLFKADTAGKHQESIYRNFNPLNITKAGTIQFKTPTAPYKTVNIQLNMLDRFGESMTIEGEKNATGIDFPIVLSNFPRTFDYEQVIQLKFTLTTDSTMAPYSGSIQVDEIRAIK